MSLPQWKTCHFPLWPHWNSSSHTFFSQYKSLTSIPVYICSCTKMVLFLFLFRTGSPPESHTLFLLLGAHVPTKQQALSLRLFSFCWLVAVGPQSLFLSTLLCFPPPLLSHLLLCFHCSAVFQKGAFGWVCVREERSDWRKEKELFRLSKLIN